MNKQIIAYSLASVIMLGMSSTDIYISSLPQMAKDFMVNADMVNMTLSMTVLGMALGCPICGFISDRYGRRKLYLSSLMGYMLISFAIALVAHLVTIICLRFIQGLLIAVFIIVSRQIISDISTDVKDQLYYTGILVTGVVISPAVAPVLGAYIADHLSWHWCFVFSGIFAGILVIILWKNLQETSQYRTPLPKVNELYGEYAVFFRSHIFNVYSAIITLSYGAYFVFITMSSFIYIEGLDVSPTTYSKIFLGLAGAFLCGNFLMQRLSKKNVSHTKIIGIGLGISMLGIILNCGVYFAHSKVTVLILLTLGAILIRCGYAMVNSTAQIIVMNAEQWRPGTAVGIIYFLQFIFGAVASIVVSAMHSSPIYGMVAVMTVLMTISLFIYLRNNKP